MMMREIFRVAWRSIRANKMRSFLTMLGIIIGVMSVIASSAVGLAAKNSVTKQVERLGSNVLTVISGTASSGGINHGSGSASTLTLSDVFNILNDDPDVVAVAPLVSYGAQVVYGANNTTTTVEGTTPAYVSIRNLTIAQGRMFFPQEVESNANVAVLGSSIAQTLFQGSLSSPVGNVINIRGIPFTVVGVAASQGTNGFQSLDDTIAIPVTTEMNLFTGKQTVNSISVSAASSTVMNQAQREIESTLRVSHQLQRGVADDFQIQSQATILSALGSITTVLTLLLGGVSAISLLVGGIGIMNIMLVSVTERTREIGIRKAIGAKRGVILSQFLLESLTLSLVGALTGLVLGGGTTFVIGRIFQLGNIVSVPAVVLAVFFALVVGIVFGVYPARKASNLKPIDALRFE